MTLEFSEKILHVVVALAYFGGNVALAGTGTGAYEKEYLNQANENAIISTLAEFITNARSVTVDTAVIRRAIYNCYAHVMKNDEAKEKLDKWFSGNSGVKNPFERASESLVRISIQSVVAQTPNNYQINWIEGTYDRQGKKIKPDLSMRGMVTWEYGPEKENLDEIIFNPLGIYIKDFNWSEVK